MKRRMPSLMLGGIGVVLILIAFAANLFTAGPAFERLTDNFRPEMKAAQLAQLRQDVNGLTAVQSEFTTKAVPQLAAAVNMTPQQFSATLAQQYPAVATGLQSIPQVTQEFNGVLKVLDAERARFEKADAIPTKSMPATTVPWAIAGAGILCIAVALFVPRRRAVSAVVLGLLLVAGPLVLALPGKADAADTMNSHLKPVYTAELVSGAKQSLTTMQAMGTELQSKLLPGLAQMLKMSPQQVQGYLATNYPAVTASLTSMPAALARFDAMVGAFDASLDDYNTAKDTSLLPIAWMIIAAGILVTGIGGYSLASGQTGAVISGRKARVPLRERLHAPGREGFSH